MILLTVALSAASCSSKKHSTQQTTQQQHWAVEQRADSVATTAAADTHLARVRLTDFDTTEVRIEHVDSQTTLVRTIRHRAQTRQGHATHTSVRHDTAATHTLDQGSLGTEQRREETEVRPLRSSRWPERIVCTLAAALLLWIAFKAVHRRS